MIWLEKIIEVQQYWRGINARVGGWDHNRWYPLNDFTLALHEHNNQ